jgi:hypothetical protein
MHRTLAILRIDQVELLIELVVSEGLTGSALIGAGWANVVAENNRLPSTRSVRES